MGKRKKSNIDKVQTFQNISLRKLINTLPYLAVWLSNHTIHFDFKLKSIHEEANLRKLYKNSCNGL